MKAIDVEQCPRCRRIVPAVSLTVVDGTWICRECRTKREPPAPIPLDQPARQAASLHGAWHDAARWTIGDGTVTVVIRAVVYLILFASIDPHATQMQLHLHAALAGILLGDLLAWAASAVVDFSTHGRQLPWQALAFTTTNVLIVGWSGHLPLPQDPYAAGFAFPFFLLTCAVKTAWWQVQRTLH